MQTLVVEILTCTTLVPPRDTADHKQNKLDSLVFGSVHCHWLSQEGDEA